MHIFPMMVMWTQRWYPGDAKHWKTIASKPWCAPVVFFSRNIGKVTPKIMYFHYLEKYFLDQSIQKLFNLILKTEALVRSCSSSAAMWNVKKLEDCSGRDIVFKIK